MTLISANSYATEIDPKGYYVKAALNRPINPNEEVTVSLVIKGPNDKLINLNNLKEVHTQKIHILVLDSNFTDYHHQHPKALKRDGHYQFKFVPKTNNPYKIWVDLTLTDDSHLYLTTGIPAEKIEKFKLDEKPKLQAEQNGLKFILSFDSELKVGEEGSGNLKVTNTRGDDYTKLKPIMGSFAHIVGFGSDYKSIAHIHPADEPESKDALGGPNLQFYVVPEQKGLMKIFAQVQTDKEEIFVPFVVEVK
jgi:hypothetical protein